MSASERKYLAEERRAIQNEHTYSQRGNLHVVATAKDTRPTIRLGPELHDLVDQGVSALRADDNLYQRDGSLVYVIQAGQEDPNAPKADQEDTMLVSGTPHLRQIVVSTLRERMTRTACWERFDKRTQAWVRTLPTDAVVQAVLNRGQWDGIRHIVGIIETPALRPDGTVITEPGYDLTTGYLYAPNEDFPAVPESPTQDDAKRALAELAECFCDFPYKSEAHRSTAIAAILTLVARPAIRGSVPAFLFDASTRGSGKTLQSDAVSLITTGRTTAKMNYPADDAELEKVLGAYALRGAAIVNFDNITRQFGGGPLDRCLTADDTVELRILGKSEIPTLRWRSVIIATGNNITLTGDTSRRVLMSRIESELENPEDRAEFKHPELLEWVRAERPRLVCAALTVLRAFFVAGCPRGDCKPWGSFGAWAQLVPPAITFAGGADPMLTRPSVEGQEEPEKQALAIILRDLPRLDTAGAGLTTKTILDALYSTERLRGQPVAPDGYDELREAIGLLVRTRPGCMPDATRLGNELRKLRGRVVGGHKLDIAPNKTRTGANRWQVIPANATIGGGLA
ncbi:hypothetical protein [Sorangium sp. So ce861]|uniref:hypothetical protein n=1 Tax=Sorangium sp. So ce861 TaxID=3133323 RepID=UPI003F5E7B48